MISRWFNLFAIIFGVWMIAFVESKRIWTPFIMALLGWAICELYAKLKKKITYQNYRTIMTIPFLVSVILFFFLPMSEAKDDLRLLVVGFFLYSFSVFALFVERKTQLVAEKKNNDQTLGAL